MRGEVWRRRQRPRSLAPFFVIQGPRERARRLSAASHLPAIALRRGAGDRKELRDVVRAIEHLVPSTWGYLAPFADLKDFRHAFAFDRKRALQHEEELPRVP